MISNPLTRKLISSDGPMFPNRELTQGSDAVKFYSMTDGSTTVIQIALYGEPIASGISKRHPDDARNQELGMALALSRAFTQAAAKYAFTVDRLLSPEPDPSHLAIKQLRKLTKADSKRRKDIRRRAAREQHRKETGWDHTNRLDLHDGPTADETR